MEYGTIGDSRNPWTLAMLRTLQTTEPRSASEQTAYSKWFDQRSDREDGRATASTAPRESFRFRSGSSF